MHVDVPYGFEYHGTHKRLVVTPVSMYCFRSLLTTLNIFKGKTGGSQRSAITWMRFIDLYEAEYVIRRLVLVHLVCIQELGYKMANFFHPPIL